MLLCFFFFKQKTAYEMRISDWSSDVCSSDLETNALVHRARRVADLEAHVPQQVENLLHHLLAARRQLVGQQEQQVDVRLRGELAAPVAADRDEQIGRASCRERVCQYV